MLYFLLAAGIFFHAFYWGAGLAWLAVPRPWRRWGWMLAPALGLALQSAVVWLAAHASLAGARSYAWTAELVPTLLLAIALVHARKAGALRGAWAGRAVAGVALVLAVAGGMLLAPMAAASRGLTTTSLGSSDHADHAAGARVLQEFSRADRVGFLDQPEVTSVHGVGSYFEYRLRLASFVPAAVMAHDGVLFGVEPRRMVSVLAAVLVLVQLPLAWFLARALVGLRGGRLAGVIAIVGLSPLQAYAVHHGALGVLGAASGIALATLAAIGAGRAAFAGRSVWRWLPLLLSGLWLTAGSQNLLLPWSLLPAGLWLVLEALRRADLRALGRVLLLVVVAAELLAVLFWNRIDGVILRLGSDENALSGWPMPLLTPEGWLGLVAGVDLEARAGASRALLVGLVALAWLAGLWWARRRRGVGLLAVCLVVPVVAGWAVLAGEAQERPLAAFAGWQLVTVFFPLLVAGAFVGLARRAESRLARGVTGLGLALVVAMNVWAADGFRRRMSDPPLRVDRHLAEVGRLESEPRVSSVNMRIADPWARLWSNALLLRRSQYFEVHEYEARRATELVGAWDLTDSQLWVRPAAMEDFIGLNRRFHAVRVGAPGHLRAAYSVEGWYQEERGGDQIWRWSDGTADVLLHNPQLRTQDAALELHVRAARSCSLRIELDGRELATRTLGEGLEVIEIPAVPVPPGHSRLALRIDREPFSPPGDSRRLAVALYRFELSAAAPGP